MLKWWMFSRQWQPWNIPVPRTVVLDNDKDGAMCVEGDADGAS